MERFVILLTFFCCFWCIFLMFMVFKERKISLSLKIIGSIFIVIVILFISQLIIKSDYQPKVIKPMEFERESNEEIKEVNEVREDKTEFLKQLVEEYFGSDLSKISMMYYDLDDGFSFEIDADKQYFPASISKLYAAITIYDLAFQNIIDLDKKQYFIQNDYEGGSGILQNMDLSKPYKISELTSYAIVHSDNIAYQMISRVATRAEIRENYENIIGHPVSRSSNGTMKMSAKDGFLIMKKIYENEENNPHYEQFISDLKQTTASGYIKEYLNYEVARKGGNSQSHVHDNAIIYSDNPYILTVYTYGLSNAVKKISEVAQIIDKNR